jgi:hypothetical protein
MGTTAVQKGHRVQMNGQSMANGERYGGKVPDHLAGSMHNYRNHSTHQPKHAELMTPSQKQLKHNLPMSLQ